MFFIICICVRFILCKMLRYIGCGSDFKRLLFKEKTLWWIHSTFYYTKEVEYECHKMPMKACMIIKERLSSAVLSRRIPIKELYFWIWLCNILTHISLNHFWLAANSQDKVLNSMRFLRSHDQDVSVESIKPSTSLPVAGRLSLMLPALLSWTYFREAVDSVTHSCVTVSIRRSFLCSTQIQNSNLGWKWDLSIWLG